MNNGACAILLAFVAAGTAVSPTRAGAGIPEIVERAASSNGSSLTGIIVEQRHVNLHVAAGPMHYDEQNDAVVLTQDGEFKQVRYLRIDKNGETVSNDEVAQREKQNNDDLAHGKGFFKQPYDARYLSDYSYTETNCACASHARSIQFRSEVRDNQHGDGTMTIDPSTARVLTVTYTPNVMPPHATTGTIVESFGEAVPGLWTIVSIDHSYTGHVAFFRGVGTLTEREDHFQRFDNRVAAMQFLQRATI